MCIKCFPGIEFNQPNALQNLGCQPYTLIRDLDAFLPLSEHDFDEENLNWEAEDKDLTNDVRMSS
jgi:hypothetical protein